MKMSTFYFALIDFHEYFLPTGTYAIKEWSVARIRPDQPVGSKHHVTKPICPWDQLEKTYQNYYNKKYQIYGVEWSAGTISLEETRQYLADFLSNAAIVYTRSVQKINILTKFLDVQLKIRPVDIDPELCPKARPVVDCQFHNILFSNYCTKETVSQMYRCLKSRVNSLQGESSKTLKRRLNSED